MKTQAISESSLTGRMHYRSSGDINLASFLLWLVPAVAVAAFLAWVMYWLFEVGHYYIIIVPFVCALAVAGLVRLAVAKGHCRNKFVGLLTGALLGVFLYIGSYYMGMLSLLGSEVAARPDVLVQYIRLRLATDVTRDTHGGADDDVSSRKRGSEFMNWFRFALESVGVVGIIAVSGGRRAGKTYCEQCKRWMLRETTPFDSTKTAEILGSLETGSSRALAALCREAPYTTVPNLTMAVEYCPTLKEGMALECPVFLSLKNVTGNPQGATLDAFEQSKGKVIERCVELNRDELAALSLRFSIFESYAGSAAGASSLPTAGPSPKLSEDSPRQVMAEISALPEENCCKVLTKAMKWKGNALAALGLLSFMAGLGLLAWGASILESADKGHSASPVAGVCLCVTGGAFVLAAVTGMLFDTSFGANRMLQKAFMAEVARRANPIVRPDDPTAHFVEIVPKLNWGKAMLDNASDIGLLVIDKARGEIRFEGDRERWRLTAASITNCGLEAYTHGQGAGATKYYFVVLRAARAEGFWEAPVRERHGAGVISNRRKKRAVKLCAEIQELCASVSPLQT